jgi:hypothetical protein
MNARRWMLIGALAVLAACTPVKPWQREILARPDMQVSADPVGEGFEDHIYFSKEASSGGRAVGGGGCGCN